MARGFRLNPGARLNVSGFFLELNVETGFYNEVESPIGLDYFEQHGSHALTPESPFLLVNSNSGLRFGLGAGENAPVLGLSAYVTLRGNPPDPDRPEITDSGNTFGIGGGVFMEYDFFSGGIGFAHQHAWLRGADFETVADRSAALFLADFHPGDFRFRGALFLLNRSDSGNLTLSPPVGMSETNSELTFGYRPLDWMEFTVGYRGSYGDGYANHMGFVGMQTYLQRNVEFQPPRR